MSVKAQPGLLAVDVGTSRVKLGWFPDELACESDKPCQLPIAAPRLPEPAETFTCAHGVADLELAGWLARFAERPRAVIASVHPLAAMAVEKVLVANEFELPRHLDVSALPIKLGVAEPTKVGIDRVLAALAVNRLRPPKSPAIVISLGTACTVNLISTGGVFEGGAILPGLAMSTQALHVGTTSLPMIDHSTLVPPENGVGRQTTDAISAGVFWGLVGGIERLIREQSRSLPVEPQLYLTGGDAPLLAETLKADGFTARLVPHLVLAGIAVACED